MNLIKSLKIGLLFIGLSLCGMAEQRTFIITGYRQGLYTEGKEIKAEMDSLLRQGWTIRSVTPGTPGAADNWYVFVFVLESPKQEATK